MIFDISLGSLIQNEPSSQNLSSHLRTEWNIVSESSIKYKIIEERFIDRRDRIFYYINSYSSLFDEKIISDAKRIVYSTEIKANPSIIAISALFLSCEINGLDFSKMFRIIKEKANEISIQSNKITLGKTFMKSIHHYSELLRNENKNKMELIKSIP